jgi:predicted O-methyltransferase YrrM
MEPASETKSPMLYYQHWHPDSLTISRSTACFRTPKQTRLYNHFQLATRYFHYLLTAANGNGHGVHSPFVFEFIRHVLTDNRTYDCYAAIENRRAQLKADKGKIEVEDYGAGSAIIKNNTRVVGDIAHSSLKPKKYARLLFRMVQYYKPARMLELGTSLGITSAYLASGNSNGMLYTCEGSHTIAHIAEQTFSKLQLNNIELVLGDFSSTLPALLAKAGRIDFAFVDGNHRREPTLQYFDQLLGHCTASTIFVFDDIHWSAEMEEAWSAIRQHPATTLTIDLFFIGLVFINPDFKVPQHFTVRF